ncbi:hypothetical protein EMCRGX_G005475 [Ephydatia muelleri]
MENAESVEDIENDVVMDERDSDEELQELAEAEPEMEEGREPTSIDRDLLVIKGIKWTIVDNLVDIRYIPKQRAHILWNKTKQLDSESNRREVDYFLWSLPDKAVAEILECTTNSMLKSKPSSIPMVPMMNMQIFAQQLLTNTIDNVGTETRRSVSLENTILDVHADETLAHDIVLLTEHLKYARTSCPKILAMILPMNQDHAQDLIQDLASLSQDHAQDLASLSQDHAHDLASLSQDHAQDLASFSQDHAHDLAYFSQDHAHDLASLSQDHAQDLASFSQDHAHDLASLSQDHAQDLASLSQDHAHDLASLSQDHAHDLASFSQDHAQDLA